MKTIGLICEYNPFHNGHIYHIQEIKKKYPDSTLILCLNGYFLERGEISILTKKDKTKIAINNGIDLVIELPCLYGCQSADTFSNTAITLLNALNTEIIIFGSETNNIDLLMDYAKKELTLDKNIKSELKKGNSYQKSLLNILKTKEILPNDLLGISYSKSVLKNNFSIKLETIKRTNNYHDLISNSKIISASNIRNKINNNVDISKYVPKYILNNIININHNTYFSFLKYRILTDNNLNNILDVKEGIENKLKKEIVNTYSLNDFIKSIESKRYPKNYVNRMLLHIFLGLEKNISKTPLSYIKILGFNDKGKNYLNQNKKNFTLPLTINKKSITHQFELNASRLYDLITNQNTYKWEVKNTPIYVKTSNLTNESNQK